MHDDNNDPMRDPEHVRSLRNFAAVLLVALVLAGAFIANVGCTGTVTPTPLAVADQASFDGNEQTSGILAADPAGRGYIITAHARERYNALVEVYGRDFTPALERDAGITPQSDGTVVIDREHLVKFLEMARWRKSGLQPRH